MQDNEGRSTMKRQLPLFAFSAVMAFAMLSAGVSQWWAWAIWAIVVFCQVAVGLGWPEKLEPKPYVSPGEKRQAFKAQFAEIDAEHEAKVQAWLDRQHDQQ